MPVSEFGVPQKPDQVEMPEFMKNWRKPKATLETYKSAWKEYQSILGKPVTFKEYVSKLTSDQRTEVVKLLEAEKRTK